MSTQTEKTKLNKIERNRSENSDATVQKMMANLYAGIEISSDLFIQAEIQANANRNHLNIMEENLKQLQCGELKARQETENAVSILFDEINKVIANQSLRQ